MTNITLGEIGGFLAFIVAFFSGVEYLYLKLKKLFNKALNPIKNDIKETRLNSDKNFIVSFLSKIENGDKYEEIETQRFYEAYSDYTKNGGNSYIHDKVEKFKKERKL